VRKRGGNLTVAASLEDLAASVEGWGYDGRAAVETIRAFNAAIVRDPGRLEPPRRYDATAVDEPPYHVVEVWPAITFTLGGLLIDPDARVLDEHGEPVPGLFAAGADSGGTYAYGYAGGLALALVFGLRAARFAARAAAGHGG
jgi:predicted oxidoreductase